MAGQREQDPYAVLGIEPDASAAEITKAYRRLVRDLHPDTNPDPAAAERFRAVAAAHDALRDPARGAADRRRTPASSGPRRVHIRGVPRRGDDLDAELRLSLGDAVYGTTATVAAVDPRTGDRTEVRTRLQAGVEDGQVVRLAGRGSPGWDGGERGDLVVTVRVAADPRFRRAGRDLAVSVPVTYPQAVLGGDVEVPTLDGRTVTVRIPAGTAPGRVLRVRGHGVPLPDGRGDLLVRVELVVPTVVSDDERRALEALAAAMAAAAPPATAGTGP